MTGFNLETCARRNILVLEPYRCARDDYKDDGKNVLLDANENAYGPSIPADVISQVSAKSRSSSAGTEQNAEGPVIDLLGLNRYPDPHQHDLKQLFCNLRNRPSSTEKPLTPANLFVGVGSDEAIDLLLRAFCRPGLDRILVCPPTYGMYSVSAQVNDVGLVKVPLLPGPGFGLDVPAIMESLSGEGGDTIKLAYFCSPGNPTGSLLDPRDVEAVLKHPAWNGVVVVDEAYVDFAASDPPGSMAHVVTRWPNLVVMQTLSKAFGMAGIRMGCAFAAAPIARLLNNIKAPYNVPSPTAALAMHALSDAGLAVMRRNRAAILAQRDRLLAAFPGISGVGSLRGGTDSNFLLVEMLDSRGKVDTPTALAVYERLADTKGVVVRFRGKEHGCEGCLRITVGTEDEVTRLLAALEKTLAEVHALQEKS